MRIIECNPIPWRQAAEFFKGPYGLPPIVFNGRLIDCVCSLPEDLGPCGRIPNYFQILVRGYEIIQLEEIRQLARMVPPEIEPRQPIQDWDYNPRQYRAWLQSAGKAVELPVSPTACERSQCLGEKAVDVADESKRDR